MNIFRLSHNPTEAAQMHCDEHVVKMILESAQMLSTALRENGRDDEYLYQPTHVNHPCTQWITHNRHGFEFVHELATALNDEKQYRYGGSHKSYDEVIARMPPRPQCIPDGTDEPPQAMDDECKANDVVDAYRAYYRQEKREFATWDNGRDRPDWMV